MYRIYSTLTLDKFYLITKKKKIHYIMLKHVLFFSATLSALVHLIITLANFSNMAVHVEL